MGRMLEFLKEMLDDATAGLPGVAPRRAFGSWGYYVNGRIFALAYAREDRLGVKLPDSGTYAAARGLAGSSEWAPHGSPMSDWVLLPADLHDDRDAVQEWVLRAFHLVRAAPAVAVRKAGAGKKRSTRNEAKPRASAATKSATPEPPKKTSAARKAGTTPAASRKPPSRRSGR
ncbi:MAG: hypothetical protein RL653_2072 [Pseudomonadota bacterium]|jgi:TfoX/Sxy family transcriptional regulator of competence genes